MELTLTQFMEQHGAVLFAQAETQFPPVLRSAEIQSRGRTPLGVQALAASAMLRALQDGRAGFLVAEMSTGKTKMALDTVMNFDPKGRYLVLCPPHLVEKWKREAEMEGFGAVILDSPASVRSLPHLATPLVAILSREKAKLGPGWEPGLIWRRKFVKTKYGTEYFQVPTCPRCGQVVKDKEGMPLEKDAAARKKHKCQCGEPIWNQKAPARVALADYLKRYLPKGFFKALILDEAHEYKAGESAQGIVAGVLADWTGRVLALTGTLFGGYASNLFHLFWRFLPGFREEYDRNEVSRFVAEYGLLERVETTPLDEDGRVSRRKSSSVTTKERPGLSPLLLPKLLPHTAFVRLREVVEALPPYSEKVRITQLEGEHRDRVVRFYHELSEAMREALRNGSKKLLGAYLQGALNGPDASFADLEVFDPESKRLVASLSAMPAEYQHPKEHELIRLVQQERAKGRRVLVYVQNTDKINQVARLEGLLKAEGIQAKGLYSTTVNPSERERWLDKQLQGGVEVVIAHPRLVQTGLDLIGFPTLVFYQTEYSVYTLRQAARRSWRIGQKHPVQVVFLAYEETLQTPALKLIATKTKSSLALEGELVEGGLTAMSEEDPTLLLAGALAGTIRLDWDGQESLGVEEGAPALVSVPEVGVREITLLELPTLKEERWVKVGKKKVLVPAGQPVLFS
jgi:superfamily II DNA or RNA helicase